MNMNEVRLATETFKSTIWWSPINKPNEILKNVTVVKEEHNI